MDRLLDRNQVAPQVGPQKQHSTPHSTVLKPPNGDTPPQVDNSTHTQITLITSDKPGARRSTSMGEPTSPDSRTTSLTYGCNTRNTIRSPISQETIEAMPNRVKDAISGKTFLESKLLCHISQPFTANHLVSVLFQITQMSSTTPVPVNAAIRAVAFILKDLETTNMIEAITQKVTNDATAKLVDHIMAAISPQVAFMEYPNPSLPR
ncbi:hypothetical protein BDR07DRAFT_1486824 [Suillus spraguei]|nr:hypothetical protein BDR07DRAFT_1486824 [Suillus spraguei]